jgi:hypothetical protein
MAGRSEEVLTWLQGLQARLMAAVSAEWEAVRATDDPARLAQAVKTVQAISVFGRTAKSVGTMVPAVKTRAAEPETDEADMHDDHPEDPQALHAALESKLAGLAAFIEEKRSAERDGGEGKALDPRRLSG